ncbi:MAG TPA: helix-turn-helix domain-containing protein [Streptosporangiaceae bacterium]|nr:helix-turn-helix domain-containing protein [Streptosporangiaceae bacterium]
MSIKDFASRVTSIGALAEPVRRALYLYVIGQPEPVSREQAAAAVGVARHVAKFNLDKLEEEDLLEVEFARPAGRGGPGAGRPAKLYKRSAREVEVSLPERRYDLAAQVMADAITQSEEHAVPIGDALREAAKTTGRALGEAAKHKTKARSSRAGALRAVQDVLADNGYQPRAAGDGVALTNCPFHALAQAHTDLMCGINLELIASLLETAGPRDVQAKLEPTPGMCCVRITKEHAAPA